MNLGVSDLDKRSSLLKMKFSKEDVDLAISRLGENAPLTELVEFIIAAQKTCSPDEVRDDIKCQDGNNQKIKIEDPIKSRIFPLIEMGFSEKEIKTAIENFGLDVPIVELADSILASRIAKESVQENKNPATLRGDCSAEIPNQSSSMEPPMESPAKHAFGETVVRESKRTILDGIPPESRDIILKKAKLLSRSRKTSFIKNLKEAKRLSEPETSSYWTPSKISEDIAKKAHCRAKLPEQRELQNNRDCCRYPSKPLYFCYSNVCEISQETWTKLSQFLYCIEPEYSNSQFFSALIRKEGSLHNLPTEKRFHVLPRSPLTIKDALPHTEKWWPSWDTRKQLSCIATDNASVPGLCAQLERKLDQFVTKKQQADIVHKCNAFNLIWVEENKLDCIKPVDVELILGYPANHTQMSGLSDADRLKMLKYSFQTDLLGYHLSGLKCLYPRGLRILSIFSGIGGAEVAISRLGVHLQCVVSVEESEVSRNILKKWWQSTGQSGALRQVEGIKKLTSLKIENLMEEFGGFDLVIAGSPLSSSKDQVSSEVEIDMGLFYEFVRVFQRVRGIMSRDT